MKGASEGRKTAAFKANDGTPLFRIHFDGTQLRIRLLRKEGSGTMEVGLTPAGTGWMSYERGESTEFYATEVTLRSGRG